METATEEDDPLPREGFIHDYIERIFALGNTPSIAQVHYTDWAELTGKTQAEAKKWLRQYAVPLGGSWYEVRR